MYLKCDSQLLNLRNFGYEAKAKTPRTDRNVCQSNDWTANDIINDEKNLQLFNHTPGYYHLNHEEKMFFF